MTITVVKGITAKDDTGGTVTSIDVSGGTTGLTTSGGPVTGSGTITIAGVLVGANGGTGVANTGKTITLGGNFITSGSFAATLTLTGTTGVTLPTTGTLSTLAGAEALSNKTITGVSVTMTGVLAAFNGTALPAGGTAGSGITFSSVANFGFFFGSGAPSLAAAKGSFYLRSDGSGVADRAYINTNGSTTWTAIATAG